MSNGWIKLHRKLLQWEWYEDTNTFRVFMHLMLNANHAERKWQGNIIAPGQLITSTAHIAKPLHLSAQQVRTALKKLENTQEITIKTTNKFTLVTLCQWELHQVDEAQITNKTTNEQQTNNKQITIKQQTNNNKQECKELKNVKNERIEQSSPALFQSTEPPILTFPCNGKISQWHLVQTDLDTWSKLYPSIDILAECRKANAWILANNKKTAGGMPKFLVSWFNRANDSAPRKNYNSGQQETTQDRTARLLKEVYGTEEKIINPTVG